MDYKMFTCIECNDKYNHLSGDVDERTCNKCIDDCDHVWEYQPEEKDTNIHEYQYCIKCNKLDETNYNEENE